MKRNHLKYYWGIFIFLLSCIVPVSKAQSKTAFTVLQWNIWQEGTKVQGGYDAIVNEIIRLKAAHLGT